MNWPCADGDAIQLIMDEMGTPGEGTRPTSLAASVFICVHLWFHRFNCRAITNTCRKYMTQENENVPECAMINDADAGPDRSLREIYETLCMTGVDVFEVPLRRDFLNGGFHQHEVNGRFDVEKMIREMPEMLVCSRTMRRPVSLEQLPPFETPRASFIPAQGNALGSSPQKPSGALKARLILAWHEAGRWPATAKRAMNPGRCQAARLKASARVDWQILF